MDAASPSSPVVKKDNDDSNNKDEKRDVKPVVKTLNRVPRACNACRKQKMRCEGAENPPCRRCRNTGLECLFEKPSREASLTGEAGLERMRALEAQVAEIKQTQQTICATLQDILGYVRATAHSSRSPSAYPQNYHHSPPNMSSPSMSTPTASHQHVNEIHHPSPPGGLNGPASHPIVHPARPTARASMPNIYPSSNQVPPTADLPRPHASQPPFSNFNQPAAPAPGQPYSGNQQASNTVLPPFSSISMPPPSSGANVSSLRYHQPSDHKTGHRYPHPSHPGNSKRHAPPSTVTSADSSDVEDDDDGGLPAYGLVAPWEVLRGLADVAIERAAKESGESSEPHSRTRSPSPDRSRPQKRRKLRHLPAPTFHDVVTKSILPEDEARELFKIFYDGCSTFLPVFDVNMDTYESLHERSPFAVDAICMVAARVRDGGGQASEVHLKLLEEVQNIARASLFAPVLRMEAVQAMILVSGWSDNGWLSGGHAVRMAMELSMHKAWPRLHKRINQGKTSREDDKDLVIMSRIWFCLYLFEHQLSYGTGRPAIMKDDESIRDCRKLLNHPLAIDDDMRLVSTVELIKIRERVHEAMSPLEGPVKLDHFDILRNADREFEQWYSTWDSAFSQKWPGAAFYRQSLQIQQLHAQLFHNATALRGINGPEDVQKIHPAQKDLAIRSIAIAQRGLDITVNSPSYREGMKYAVHYTHATATFAASFLLRLARLL
ncbi:priB protein, variant 2 [Coprinopsis cinerea AmutBmut pab1-1]|nr:priB protein, variant 2 [Coprinopsis cinerea AmutBmut pab1-1]